MEKLAQAILKAVELREFSYDAVGASKAILERKHPNLEDFYGLELHEAADMACEQVGFDNRGTEPVYLLLKNSWNDVLDWAQRYKKDHEQNKETLDKCPECGNLSLEGQLRGGVKCTTEGCGYWFCF